jgi:hypothetical protein
VRAVEEGWSQTHEDVEVGRSLALAGDEDCVSQIVHSFTPKWFLLAPSAEAGADDDGRRIGSSPRFPSPLVSGQATMYCSLLPCKSYAEVLKHIAQHLSI